MPHKMKYFVSVLKVSGDDAFSAIAASAQYNKTPEPVAPFKIVTGNGILLWTSPWCICIIHLQEV